MDYNNIVSRKTGDWLVIKTQMPYKKIMSKEKAHIDWEKVVNIPLRIFNFQQGIDVTLYITYIEKIGSNVMVDVKYKDNVFRTKYESVIKGKIKNILTGRKLYRFPIDYEQDGWLITKHLKNSHGAKRYEIRDLTKETEYFLEIDEAKLLSRGFPPHKNRLVDLKNIDTKPIINKEDIYSFAVSEKEIDFNCLLCGEITRKPCYQITQAQFVGGNFYCTHCSPKRSYPEKVFKSFLTSHNISYEEEVYYRIKGRNRKVDFVIYNNNEMVWVEINGNQHYSESYDDYFYAKESDNDKMGYAKINNIRLITIDAKYSKLNYIYNNMCNSEISNVLNIRICKEKIKENLTKHLKGEIQ